MIAIDVQGLTSADKYALLECLQSRGWNSCDLSRYFAHPFWLINQYQVIFSMDTTPFGGEPLPTYTTQYMRSDLMDFTPLPF